MQLTPLQIKLNSLAQTFKARELMDNASSHVRSHTHRKRKRKRIKKYVPLTKLTRVTCKKRTRPYKKLSKSAYSRKHSID